MIVYKSRFWYVFVQVLLFVLFSASSAFAQGGSVNGGGIVVLSATGRPIGGALVTICAFGATGIPCSPTITVYTDPTLGTPATNPATSDGNGNMFRYASPGRYTYTVTGTGIIGTSYTATVSGSGGGTGDVLSGGNNTFTGNNTHSGAETFTGLICPKNINGDLYVSATNCQGWAGADIGAWVNAAIQALPASPVGGTVHLTNNAVMNFSTTISIDRPVHLTGALGSLNGRGTQLAYTGSGIAISIPANGGGTGTILENFSLDNTGTGTVGIDADSGNSDMRFWNIDINPSVPFSVASIRIGNTTSGNPLVNMALEGLRVENGTTGVKLLRGNHVVISRTALFANTVNDLQIGDATHAVFDFECRNCEIEPNTVTTSTNVLINNVQHAVFTDGYAETSITAANPWISIPNTATLADGIIIRGYRFKSNAATAQSIAIVNLASATLGIEDSYASNYAASSFWVTNTSSRHVWFMGIHSDSTNISPASVNTNVEFFSSAQGSTIFGARVSSLLSVGVIRSSLQLSDQGVSCTNGELALSAGWQSTGSATVTAVAGNGQTCSWTITTGTTTAANPTITDTLTNALPAATTVCWMNIYGGTHTAVAGESLRQTTLSATAPIFTANFTPTAGGTTYFVTRSCGP